MPQMAPLNWLTLMIMFILVFYLFNTLNYYSFLYKNKSTKKSNMKNITINWKW